MPPRTPWAVAAALLACTPTRPAHSPDPRPASPQQLTAVERSDGSLMATTPSNVKLSVASSTSCKPLHLSTDGRDKYIGYGQRGTFVRLLPGGEVEDLSIPSDVQATKEIGTVTAIEAAWDDNLLVRVDEPSARLGTVERLYLRAGGRWSLLDPADQAARWLDGSVLTSYTCRPGVGNVCKPLDMKVFGGTPSTPMPQFPQFSAEAAELACANEHRFTARPDGQFYASAKLCHSPTNSAKSSWYALRWSPANGPQIDRMPYDPGLEWSPGPIAMVAPDRLHAAANVVLGERRHGAVASFDGAAWSLLPALAGNIVQLEVDPEGALWLLVGDDSHTRIVRRLPGGEWTRLDLPHTPVEFGGLGSAWPWIREQGGDLWLRPAAGKFALAPILVPGFESSRMRTRSVAVVGDEVFVTAVVPLERALGSRPCDFVLRSGTGTLLPDLPG